MSPRPIGYATLAVLKSLADDCRYGFDVIDHTGLPSGTVYPALATLTRKGFVKARWEDEAIARGEGRPRRKYYEVTRAGNEELERALARMDRLGLGALSARPEAAS